MRAASVKAGAAFLLMNLGRLKRMLEEGFMRSDLEHNYVEYINRGLRKPQQDRDWSFMKRPVTVTIKSGQSSVQLPEDFKSLTVEQYPIAVSAAGDSARFPCDLTSLEISIARKATTFWQPSVGTVKARRAGLPVFLTNDSDDSVYLNTAAPADEDLDFLVSCYRYLPPLVKDEDENPLTRGYPDLVEAAVKVVAFSAANDFETAGQFSNSYVKLLDDADISNQRRLRAGRPVRMGG